MSIVVSKRTELFDEIDSFNIFRATVFPSTVNLDLKLDTRLSKDTLERLIEFLKEVRNNLQA